MSFGFTIFFVYVAFKDISLKELLNSLREVSLFWFLLLLIITIASHLLRAWRWQILLRSLKQKTSFRNSFGSVMIGYLINLGIPRMGELVRPYIMSKRENINGTATLGTVITERLLDLSFFILFCLLVFTLFPNLFQSILPSMELNNLLINTITILVLIKIILILFFPNVIRKIANYVFNLLPIRISKIGENLLEGILSLHKLPNKKDKLFVIIQTIGIILLYTLSFQIAFNAFPAMGLQHLGFESALILMVASGVAFALPAPSGFGTFHTFITFILVTNYSIPKSVALSYAIATHEMSIILIAIVGSYYFIRFNISMKEIRKNEVVSN